MKAAILVEQNKPLIIDEVRLPNKLELGQVLVQIHYSGICGSQLGEIEGVKGEDAYMPHLLGHEGSGTVLQIGLGVKQIKPKDKVILHWRKSLGIESDLPLYKWKNHKLNAGWVTTFNEFAIVSENRCTPIPNDSDMRVASLFGCAIPTGFGVVENNARLKIGESLIVFGSGGIGLSIIQAAELVSAYPIIAVDIHKSRLDLAMKMGASHTINSRNQDVKQAITEITKGKAVDSFIDNTGDPKVIELGYELTKTDGKVILVGVPSKNNNISIYSLPLHFGKRLIGSHGGNGILHLDIPRYFDLYRNSKIKLDELLTDEFELSNINNAINSMRKGNIAGRCLIKMDSISK